MSRASPLAVLASIAAAACADPWRSPDASGVRQWSAEARVAEEPWSSALVVVADDGDATRSLRRGLAAALAADLERARARPTWHRADRRIFVAGPRTGVVTELHLRGERLGPSEHEELLRAFSAAVERPDGAGPPRPLAVADDLAALLYGARAPRSREEEALFGRLDPGADPLRAAVVVGSDAAVAPRPEYPVWDTIVLAPAAPDGRCDAAARFPDLVRGGAAPTCSTPPGLGLETGDEGRVRLGASATRCALTVRAAGCGARPAHTAIGAGTCIMHALEGPDAAACEGGRPSGASGFCLADAGGPDAAIVFAGGAAPRRGDVLGLTCERPSTPR